MMLRIPVLTAVIAAAFCSCAYASSHEIVFKSVPVPKSDLQMRSVIPTDEVVIDGRSVKTAYRTIARSGDKIGAYSFGALVDYKGRVLHDDKGQPRISSHNDFSSLLHGTKGGMYMVSHFEDTIGAMYLTELLQNPKTGLLSAVRTRPLDFSKVNGGYTHCAGSVTPWGTHLGSEEYEPNAAKYPGNFSRMADYFAGSKKANAYDYGFNIEIDVDDFDHAQVTKHYAMGRFSWELGRVMPDRRTVYASDDGTNVGFFRFVADREGDLSAGNLYAAKWQQSSDAGMGSAEIQWVSLGHATDADIKHILDSEPTFDSIFMRDVAGCKSILTSTGKECLKLREGMDQIASRLETRRYAAMKGATTEFRKLEGITYNPDARQLFLSVSEINKGMLDNADGGNNDVRLQRNDCGAVYVMSLDDEFVVRHIEGLVAGRPHKGDKKNTCDLDSIANPDNLTYTPGYDTLIIGEDSSTGHRNDAIWAFSLRSKKLTRIQTTPYGAETTSAYFYPNLNGFAYLMSVVQHPYGESDEDKLKDQQDARAYTGYIGPFPAMDKP